MNSNTDTNEREIIRPIRFIPDEKNLSKSGMIIIDQSRSAAEKKLQAKNYYEGMVGCTNKKELYTITEYNSVDDVHIQFLDKYKSTQKVGTRQIKSGLIKNPYSYNKYGGCMGIGPYNQQTPLGKKIYFAWYNMLRRISEIYSLQRINSGYYGYDNYINGQVLVCDEWRNFQTFGEWYENYWNLIPDKAKEKYDYEIDKDILQWNISPKIYSPSTCCLIPSTLNSVVSQIYIKDGNPYDVYKTSYDTYYVQVQIEHNKKTYGTYKTLEEAFESSKRIKERLIRELATKYYNENAIFQNVYEAVLNLKIL